MSAKDSKVEFQKELKEEARENYRNVIGEKLLLLNALKEITTLYNQEGGFDYDEMNDKISKAETLLASLEK